MSFRPPYTEIARLIHEGSVVFFLGAGASACGRPPDYKWKWKEGAQDFPPLGTELAEFLANAASFPSRNPHDRADLARVASYFEHVAVDRPGLMNRLRGIFKPTYKPGPVHEYLADLEVPVLIVTTNYDDLIEQAFRSRNRPFHLVVHPTDSPDTKRHAGSVLWYPADAPEKAQRRAPNELRLSLKDVPIVYKMHGSVDPGRGDSDHFLITEEDYIKFLGRMTSHLAPIPSRIELIFRYSRFLFLGYGLRDWNFRVMLHNLRHDRRSWAVQYRPNEIERQIWDSQKIRIYNLELSKFIQELRR